MDNQKIAYTLGRGRASISVLSGPEILIWINGPGAALRGWSRSGYLDQEGLEVDPGPDLQSGAIGSYLQVDQWVFCLLCFHLSPQARLLPQEGF